MAQPPPFQSLLDELPQLLEAGASDARELLRALSAPAIRDLQLASSDELDSLRQLLQRTATRAADLEVRIAKLEALAAGGGDSKNP